jgi:hypothetical protein
MIFSLHFPFKIYILVSNFSMFFLLFIPQFCFSLLPFVNSKRIFCKESNQWSIFIYIRRLSIGTLSFRFVCLYFRFVSLLEPKTDGATQREHAGLLLKLRFSVEFSIFVSRRSELTLWQCSSSKDFHQNNIWMSVGILLRSYDRSCGKSNSPAPLTE